jgi:aminotransferase in exopolysaccharide biosynthesis
MTNKITFQEIVGFIKSLYPNDNPIPLHAPRFLGREKEYLTKCIDTTFVSYVGQFVNDFEEHIKRLTGAKHAIAIVNGTCALKLLLIAAGVKPGDEIITQAISFVATAAAIKHAGAEPIFIDVEEETLGMSPDSLRFFLKKNAVIKNKILINKKTGNRIFAVIPMHTFGHPVRIDEIANICLEYNILLIEDAAESLGSYYKNKHTGTFGKAAILSFNGNKIVTTGGGGMIISDDQELIDRARHLSTTAKKKHPWEFYHDMVGYNYRLPNINAAIGCAQMEYIEKTLKNKKETAALYKSYFSQSKYIFIKEPEDSCSNYWLNGIIFKNKEERDEFLEFSNANGVQTRPVWKLIPFLPPYKSCYLEKIPVSKILESRIVNLPSSIRV